MHSYDPLERISPSLKQVLDSKPLAEMRANRPMILQILQDANLQTVSMPLGEQGYMTYPEEQRQILSSQAPKKVERYESAPLSMGGES
jgi:hypothetical protein